MIVYFIGKKPSEMDRLKSVVDERQRLMIALKSLEDKKDEAQQKVDKWDDWLLKV